MCDLFVIWGIGDSLLVFVELVMWELVVCCVVVVVCGCVVWVDFVWFEWSCDVVVCLLCCCVVVCDGDVVYVLLNGVVLLWWIVDVVVEYGDFLCGWCDWVGWLVR